VKLVEAYKEHEQSLNVLVNCAGVMRDLPETYKPGDSLEQIEKSLWSAEWDDFTVQLDTNLTSLYFVTIAFLPLLKLAKDDPSVCNIASIAAWNLSPSYASTSYGPSKAGGTSIHSTTSSPNCRCSDKIPLHPSLTTLPPQSSALAITKQLASRLSPFNVRVNSICPGIFPSEMTSPTQDAVSSGPLAETIKTNPIPRAGREEEIVGPLVFLSSKAGGYCTGAVLVVDGGRKMTTSAMK
jgi:NAD(P)-dependent dehydrogenase (short-subunit alcohol dehydrogenase family)